MNPIDPRTYLQEFPTGSRLVQLEAPEGMEDVVSPAIFIKSPDDTFFLFFEFTDNEEREAFFRSERIVIRTLGIPNPIMVGAVNLELTQETEEGTEIRLLPERN